MTTVLAAHRRASVVGPLPQITSEERACDAILRTPDRNRRQLHPQPPKRVTVRPIRKLPPQRGR